MKKQLLAVGDSFTSGQELKDLTLAWPHLVGQAIDYDVVNIGAPGTGNTSILRRTINELAINHYDLIVIGWSNPGRIEWKDSVGNEWNLWPGAQLGNFFNETPWRNTLLNYVNQYHSPEYLFEMYVLTVISLQSFCKANNIKCVMIDTTSQNYYRQAGMLVPRIGNLLKLIDTSLFVDNGQVGMDTVVGDTERGPGGHFLEEGHQLVADKIYEHIRNLGWLS